MPRPDHLSPSCAQLRSSLDRAADVVIPNVADMPQKRTRSVGAKPRYSSLLDASVERTSTADATWRDASGAWAASSGVQLD